VIHIFDVMFHEKKLSDELSNVFLTVMNTIKTLFTLSKVKGNDKMFIEENLIPDLLTIIQDYYLIDQGEQKLLSITSKKILKDG